MVRKLGKILCSIYLFTFLALTMDKTEEFMISARETTVTNRNMMVM